MMKMTMPQMVRRCVASSSSLIPRRYTIALSSLYRSEQLLLRCGRRQLGSSPTTTTTTEPATSSTPPLLSLVYQSPLGDVVSKLRTVSLATAIIGSTGVPCMVALKGAIPEMGMLAVAMMFVTGSIGSTAAIHFVFSPYVYRIEVVPIRQCSSNPGSDGDSGTSTASAAAATVTVNTNEESSGANSNTTNHGTVETVESDWTNPPKDALLRAWTRSLFLRHHEVVFDPEHDVTPYSGMRPLCNFVAKGVPLYVHPEYVYDAKLRKAMNLNIQNFASPTKSNPDDDLL